MTKFPARHNEVWIVQFDGKNIDMEPTPSEPGAHARAKAHFFDEIRWGKEYLGNKVVHHHFDLTDDQQNKEFKAWYKQHCKAVRLL